MKALGTFAMIVLIAVSGGCSAGGGPEEVTGRAAAGDTRGSPPVAPTTVDLPPRTDLGSIEGRVRFDGTPPGNRVIRMNMDPRCAEITQGTMIVQMEVDVSEGGGLANVFVQVDGEFPRISPSEVPVRIDQQGCMYAPRVVGVQVGQTVEIHNSDDLPHNLHALSSVGNGFNVGQPRAGLVYRFVPQAPEMMLHLSCDLHRWMTTYIGVVAHPYFDVSGPDGDFRIDGVPAGTYSLHSWHEVYGEQTTTVEVRENETTLAEFVYVADTR